MSPAWSLPTSSFVVFIEIYLSVPSKGRCLQVHFVARWGSRSYTVMMVCTNPGVAPSKRKIVWMVVISAIVLRDGAILGALFKRSKESKLSFKSDINQIVIVRSSEFVYFREPKVIISGGDFILSNPLCSQSVVVGSTIWYLSSTNYSFHSSGMVFHLTCSRPYCQFTGRCFCVSIGLSRDVSVPWSWLTFNVVEGPVYHQPGPMLS